MEYACIVWSPHIVKDVHLLEAVERCDGLVVVVGAQLHILGPFSMIHVISSYT